MAQLECGTPCEETIHRQKDRQPWEPGLESLRQPIESLQFTVLFGRLFSWVLNELAHKREGEAVGGDKFGFQNGVVVKGLSVVGAGETMGTVTSTETDRAGSIDDHNEVDPQ